MMKALIETGRNILLATALLGCCFTSLMAQTNSILDANWNSTTTWSGGVVPGPTTTVNVGTTVLINTNISITSGVYQFGYNGTANTNTNVTDPAGGTAQTITINNPGGYNAAQAILDIKSGTTTFEGAANFTNANIFVRSGATLILGPTTIGTSGKTNVTIETGATLIINGNLTDGNTGGLFTINGFVQVNGNYSTSTGNVVVDATSGSFQTTGSMSTSGSSNINGTNNDCLSGPCSAAALSCTDSGNKAFTGYITATPTNQTICSEDIFALTFNSSALPSPGITSYQWQSSPDLITINSISDALTSTYSSSATSDTYFRVLYNVNKSGCPQQISAWVKISVVNANITASSPTICTTGTVILSGNQPGGGATGSWTIDPTNPVGLTGTFTNSSAFNSGFTPTGGPGEYKLRWTVTGASCSEFAIETVNVTSSLPASVTVTSSTGATVCAGANTTFTATPTNGGTSPQYQWKKNGVNISGAISSTYTTSALAVNDIIACEMTSSSSCATGSPASGSIAVTAAQTWLGTTSDWNTPSNWSCGIVPTPVFDITISSGAPSSPNINSNADVKSLTINAGATVTVSSGATLNIYGGLINSGTLNVSGRLELLSSTDVYNAEGSGSGVLTLISTSDTQAGSIGKISTPANFSGNITVQRHMGQQLANKNRYIAMPVTGMVLNVDLTELGLSSGGFVYNETVLGDRNNGWVQTAKSYAFEKGRGFLAYNAPVLWEVRGPLTPGWNSGDVTFPVSFTPTPSGSAFADGWSLLGNPYPAAIQWSNDPNQWTKSSTIDPVVYVTDMSVNGGVFRTHNPSTGLGDLTGGVIAMGQAFWVHANAQSPSPSVVIHENAKVISSGKFYRKSAQEIPSVKISLSNGEVTDNAFLLMDSEATSRYDRGIDALKLEGMLMGISLLSEDDVKLVHYATNALSKKDIPLNIMASEEGNFSMAFELLTGMDQFKELYLVDTYARAVHPLSSTVPYEFAVTQNTVTKEGRFFLSKEPNRRFYSESVLSIFPNPVMDLVTLEVNALHDVTVEIVNLSGVRLQQSVMGTNMGVARGVLDMKDFTPGVYIIKTWVEGRLMVEKVIKR
jgi:hypothetical protein